MNILKKKVMEDMKQTSLTERFTANLISAIICFSGMYFMSYSCDWKFILGIFLFVWSNNIVMRYNIINAIESKINDTK
jgi:hypothetical protein